MWSRRHPATRAGSPGRGCARRLWIAAGLALGAACGDDAATVLPATPPVVRLGSAGGTATVAGVTRPVLAPASAGEWRLPLPPFPAARVLLAVARREGPPAVCRARLAGEGGAEAGPAVSFPLGGGEPAWLEGELAVPAGFRGALHLQCSQAGRAKPAVAWARPRAVPADAPRAPLLVLLSLDTLRADRVPGFGGDAELAPNLGRLAAEGVRMTAATAWGTWTLPSHAVLLRSLLYGFEEPDLGASRLVGLLAEAGFATEASVGGGWMGAELGFAGGFDRYAEHPVTEDADARTESDLPEVLADARSTLERLAGVPTFLFVHSYAVHELGPDAASFLEERDGLVPIDLPPEALARERAFYDSLVRRADARLGPFFETLRRSAEERPVLLVVVSDHGEAFGEHGSYGHGLRSGSVTLHDEVVRVPMIAWGPGLVPGGRASDRPTGLVDVGPTLLDAAGVSPPPDAFEGASLWPFWSGASESPPPSLGSVSHIEGTWALRDAGAKLIVHLEDDGGERLELYDLAEDPEERNDLAATQPARTRALRARLLVRLAELGIEPAVQGRLPRTDCRRGDRSGCDFPPLHSPRMPAVSDETREKLRGLGYRALPRTE